MSKLVAQKIMTVWANASIPTVSEQRVEFIVIKNHQLYMKTLKHLEDKSESKIVVKNVQQFWDRLSKLFDIAACKSANFDRCKCKKSKNVPFSEGGFLVDQRTVRKKMIGGIDRAETQRLTRKQQRNKKRNE